jgi:hypothetical protein
MAPRIDGIAKLLNCPTKGNDIRQAIKQSRKDFGLEAEAEDDDGGPLPASGNAEPEEQPSAPDTDTK